MKRIAFILAICLGILPAMAQRIVEKHLNFSAGKMISMDFQISDSIRIVTWDKNEVYVKSSINVNDHKYNNDYHMNFDQTDDNIRITGKLEIPDTARRRNNGNWNGDCCCCCNCHTEIIHEVYIPANADISVETINGNIVLTGSLAGIRAHTISGYIDLAIAPARKADLSMKTISGTFFSNIEFPVESTDRLWKVGGGSVMTQLNGGVVSRLS